MHDLKKRDNTIIPDDVVLLAIKVIKYLHDQGVDIVKLIKLSREDLLTWQDVQILLSGPNVQQIVDAISQRLETVVGSINSATQSIANTLNEQITSQVQGLLNQLQSNLSRIKSEIESIIKLQSSYIVSEVVTQLRQIMQTIGPVKGQAGHATSEEIEMPEFLRNNPWVEVLRRKG